MKHSEKGKQYRRRKKMWETKTKVSLLTKQYGAGMGNGGSIVMGAHWNTQNTSKYTCILMYFAYSNGPPSQYCHH